MTISTLNVGTGPVKNSSNGAVVEQMPNDDSPRTKPPPKPKIRNATGGRNPQTLWKLGHGSLMTNMERKRRKMTTSSVCPMCNEEDETLMHCFRDSLTATPTQKKHTGISCLASLSIRSGAIVMTVRWSPPQLGVWKLNCDGSVFNYGRAAGCGGILRNCQGNLDFAFMHKLHHCSSLEAELWGIYHGTCIAWSRGFKDLIIESDCAVAIDALNGNHGSRERDNPIVKSILAIGDGELLVKWSWVDRDMNSVADKLATSSYETEDLCVIVENVPDFLASLYSVVG